MNKRKVVEIVVFRYNIFCMISSFNIHQ